MFVGSTVKIQVSEDYRNLTAQELNYADINNPLDNKTTIRIGYGEHQQLELKIKNREKYKKAKVIKLVKPNGYVCEQQVELKEYRDAYDL